MTLDTSAVVAILRNEVERAEFLSLIDKETRRMISAVSVLEAAMVLEGRSGADAGSDLDLFLIGLRLRSWLLIKNNSLWLVRPFGDLGRAVIPLDSTLGIALRMRWHKGPASHCCSKGRISRRRMLSG